jgi:hypothetical protein
MLRLAGVKKEDVVYDLGCGDGRIVIAAAKGFGARGVGVDLDPQCIVDSKANARKAHVEDLVTFERRDLFKTDISKATVVALYLSPELNRRLAPKLLKEMRPGTRVVAHVYDMGDWAPDRTEPVPDSKQFKLFLWTIPAQVAGEWRWTGRSPDGPQSDVLRLMQRYQKLQGTLMLRGKPLRITTGEMSGDRLRATVEGGEPDSPILGEIRARVSGAKMEGTLQLREGNRSTDLKITAAREGARG